LEPHPLRSDGSLRARHMHRAGEHARRTGPVARAWPHHQRNFSGKTIFRISAILSGSSSLYCLHPARAQAACQGVDRHLSKPPTFTARWRRSANRVVKGPSPKGTATARLRRFQTFLPSSRNKEVRPFPDFRPGVSNRILCNGRTYQDAPETSTCRRCIKCVLTRPAPFASPRRQPNGCPRLCWVLLLRKEIQERLVKGRRVLVAHQMRSLRDDH